MSLCIFVGSAAPPNIQRLVVNWSDMLGDEFDLHLVTTKGDGFTTDALSGYSVFGKNHPDTIGGEFRALAKYLSYKSPDVVTQVTRPPIHGLITGILTTHYNITSIYRYAGDRFYEFKVSNVFNKASKFILNNIIGRAGIHLSDWYIALGPSGEKQLLSRGVSAKQLTQLPPSINPERFTQDVQDPCIPLSQSERTSLLFLGRLSRLKGLKTLKKTLPEIFDNNPTMDFHIVGSKEGNLSLPAKYRNRVIAHGFVPPEEVNRYLRHADLLVHPSLTEGIPRAILEALCVGTPVVARDVGDVSKVTSNTFSTSAEFVSLVNSYKSLSADDVRPFTTEELTQDYIDFFKTFTAHPNEA